MGRRSCSPKRSKAAVVMNLERYVCEISVQQDKLEGMRFSELEELEKLYYNISKKLRLIAKKMQEVADDKN